MARRDEVAALRRELATAKWLEKALRKQLAAAEREIDHLADELASLHNARPVAQPCANPGCDHTVYVVPQTVHCPECAVAGGFIGLDDEAAA